MRRMGGFGTVCTAVIADDHAIIRDAIAAALCDEGSLEG